MATTKFYLDKRATLPGTPAPVKISLCIYGKSALVSTGIKVLAEQWDEKYCKVVRHPQRQYLNTILSRKKNEWDMALLRLNESGEMRSVKSVTELKRKVMCMLDPSCATSVGEFKKRFLAFAESRYTQGNRDVYMRTLRKMEAFDPELGSKSFQDIDRQWLRDFERFMERTSRSANGRAVHFRNIRAVFNDAIDDEVISCYPFRKFKIKTQPTAKRSLSVEQLRTLMTMSVEEYQEKYRDIFVLMFYLCGVNAVDLLNAKPDALRDGRFEYIRAKTHKLYSIKVEPEAMAIIERYRGKDYLLEMMDTRRCYLDFLRRMNRALKQLGTVERHGLGGKKTRHPLFPNISQYWCRHTWATVAASIDIPKETIAAGLGHGGNTVTDIYIDFDRRKVDEANRRVIDWVLKGIGNKKRR